VDFEIDRDNSQDVVREIKPAYRPPVLTELDAGETANGLIDGAPENNVTYS
jgi:hypothetical protein